ncbi:MAG TPA: PLP-dependent aminotransferase family protein [Microlunatus sp.]
MVHGSDFLQLDPHGVVPGRRADWLSGRLRTAVADGTVQLGSRLPATRTLAAELGFARGTVSEAYGRLIEEGVLTTNRGGGTTVAARPATPRQDPGRSDRPVGPAPRRTVGAADEQPIDLDSGVPDLSAFPRGAWLRAERRVLERATSRQLGYAPPQGVGELRQELAGWLAQSRGVAATADQIVITGGVTGAVSLIYQLLAQRGEDVVAVEDPSAEGNRRVLQHWARRTVGVGVDVDGIDTDALGATDARAVVVTPAHQYPTGTVLSAERRRSLLDWANVNDGLIIEDDYDAEYRYDRAPVRALQPLDPDHVAYTASLSKTLAPALRLGWLIPPDSLLDKVIERRWAIDLGAPALPQLVLAELLRSGVLARHLRSMRVRHRARRDALIAAVTERLPGCTIGGIAAGIYLLIMIPADLDDAELAERARARGVLLQPLSRHRIAPGPPGLIMTYADHSPDRLSTAVDRLAAIWPRN